MDRVSRREAAGNDSLANSWALASPYRTYSPGVLRPLSQLGPIFKQDQTVPQPTCGQEMYIVISSSSDSGVVLRLRTPVL